MLPPFGAVFKRCGKKRFLRIWEVRLGIDCGSC